jgi:hypothetical protein
MATLQERCPNFLKSLLKRDSRWSNETLSRTLEEVFSAIQSYPLIKRRIPGDNRPWPR